MSRKRDPDVVIPLDRVRTRSIRGRKTGLLRVSVPVCEESSMADILKFTEDHLWLRVEGNRAQLGISEYGQAELGEVIAVELPDVGDEVEKGEPFGELESVRTVSELLSPLSGTVTAINSELEDHPAIVNEDPYHEGWLVEIKIADEAELEELMDSDEYEEFAAGEDEG
jgi:glycine cleavage system H protein